MGIVVIVVVCDVGCRPPLLLLLLLLLLLATTAACCIGMNFEISQAFRRPPPPDTATCDGIPAAALVVVMSAGASRHVRHVFDKTSMIQLIACNLYFLNGRPADTRKISIFVLLPKLAIQLRKHREIRP